MTYSAQPAWVLRLMYVKPFVPIGVIGILLKSNGPSNYSNNKMNEFLRKVQSIFSVYWIWGTDLTQSWSGKLLLTVLRPAIM